jgi:YidC/Oxa1 family membrane protein insertase
MLVIKNYIVDDDKIHAQIQENKKKSLRTRQFNENYKRLWNKEAQRQG